MRHWIGTLLLGLSLTASATESPSVVSTRLLDHLQAADYAAAEKMFSPEMAQAVPADKLKQVWESLGALRQRGETRLSEVNGMQVATTRLQFAAAAINAQVAVNAQGQVAGFLLRPAEAEASTIPSVPADAPYRERDLTVGSGDTALPATLAIPNGAGPFPAVVLVHGSGPQDRNETVGPNRPFLDIARGLAAQGIAVLRYEKRSRAHPEQFTRGGFDVDDETTDDAVAALVLLRTQPNIDKQRLFVLGHSQGGMLAPRIARTDGSVAGVVFLAAPARPLLTLLLEQNRYLLGAQIDSPQGREHMTTLEAQVARIRDAATPADATDTPLKLPVGYWRSLDAVDAVGDARALKVPMLFLQGGRDFQVVDADWQIWRTTFAKDSRASFHAYPNLNHLGIAGTGPGSLAEYQQPGHVDAVLIGDVASWIKEH